MRTLENGTKITTPELNGEWTVEGTQYHEKLRNMPVAIIVSNGSEIRELTGNVAVKVIPTVGLGCSYGAGSDSYPATVHSVSASGKSIMVSDDEIIVTDEWKTGEYSPGTYSTLPNSDPAAMTEYTLRKNGAWLPKGTPMNHYWASLTLGVRTYKQDPHF